MPSPPPDHPRRRTGPVRIAAGGPVRPAALSDLLHQFKQRPHDRRRFPPLSPPSLPLASCRFAQPPPSTEGRWPPVSRLPSSATKVCSSSVSLPTRKPGTSVLPGTRAASHASSPSACPAFRRPRSSLNGGCG
ncbi:hypothetical protein PVAP13_3NG079564 [Panicum virgatum]|uniref:Uncharacterized protein n=1 Tax=Panicum virgatum TaxID=38727 RepID=A0A8T0UBJ2_PANVG|nr:hypothetical protein PVAP13_3NG079564 [Panicum virgatum]